MNARECAIKLMRRCNSNNPFTIARALDVILIYCTPIDLNGFYQYHKRNHIIYLSEDLDEDAARFVLAHELGHMQMHRDLNTVFMDTKTFNPHLNVRRTPSLSSFFSLTICCESIRNAQYTNSHDPSVCRRTLWS